MIGHTKRPIEIIILREDDLLFLHVNHFKFWKKNQGCLKLFPLPPPRGKEIKEPRGGEGKEKG